jgi:putative oxidoreductase
MKNEHLNVIASSVLILLYSYTAMSKLIGYEVFEANLSRSPLMGPGANTIAWVLPAAELIVVLLLFFEATRKTGLYASLFLLVLFTSYLLYMILFVDNLPCSCGGVLSKMSWQQHIWFNLFFILLNVLALLAFRKQEQVVKDIQY